MNSTPSPREPRTDQFASLSVSQAVKEALSSTNALVHRLYAVPDDVATPELQDDVDRLLDLHLPGLLSAYRDAHATGAATADGDLINALEHVREELGRILAALQLLAGGRLATQRGFLEQRYPRGADPLEVIAPGPQVAVGIDGANRATLDVASLDVLLPNAAHRSSLSRPGASGTESVKSDADKWDATNVIVAVLCVAFLVAFVIWFGRSLNAASSLSAPMGSGY